MILAAAVALSTWIFSDGPGDVTPGGSPGLWAWGVPTVGPGGADDVWGTRLDGPYLNESDDTLTFDLPADVLAGDAPKLALRHWYDIRVGDRAVVEVEQAGLWTEVAPYRGYPVTEGFVGRSEGWVESAWDLSDRRDATRARLRFVSDAAVVGDGWFVAEIRIVDGDAVPPVVRPVALPVNTDDPAGGQLVSVIAEDDVGVVEAVLVVSFDGAPVRIPMVFADGVWTAEMPPAPLGAVVSWHVEVSDLDATTRFPADDDASYVVALARPGAPQAILGGGRAVAQRVSLTWEPPASRHPVLGYALQLHAGTERGPVNVDAPPAWVTLDPDHPAVASVAARYEIGVSEPSASSPLAVEVPALLGLSPAKAWPGERIWVTLTGRSLYMLDGHTRVAVSGVVVEAVEVRHADEARLAVRVVEGTAPGPRSVVVSGAHGTATFDDAFLVAPPEDRPTITAVTPDAVRQGTQATVTVRASAPFARAPVVFAPATDAAFVASVNGWSGDTVTLTVAASPASPPGETTIVLDDGERLWTVPVEVTRWVPRETGCATVGGAPALTALLGALAAVRRRRR